MPTIHTRVVYVLSLEWRLVSWPIPASSGFAAVLQWVLHRELPGRGPPKKGLFLLVGLSSSAADRQSSSSSVAQGEFGSERGEYSCTSGELQMDTRDILLARRMLGLELSSECPELAVLRRERVRRVLSECRPV
jgi:hypothetical protein